MRQRQSGKEPGPQMQLPPKLIQDISRQSVQSPHSGATWILIHLHFIHRYTVHVMCFNKLVGSRFTYKSSIRSIPLSMCGNPLNPALRRFEQVTL